MTESDKNNAFNAADDLLDELQELEKTTESMQASVEQATEKRQTLADTPTPDSIDANALSLDAAKTAQKAAEQIQNATEATIKLSHEQKHQFMELSDFNLSWKQSLRNTARELESSKKTQTILFVTAISLSLVAVLVMGILFYSMSNKYDTLKNDVVDVISTESALFNKQMNLKFDQMGSLIEAMASDIQHLPLQGQTEAGNSNRKTEMTASASEAEQPLVSDKTTSDHSAKDASATPKPSTQSSIQTSPEPIIHRQVIEKKVVLDDTPIKDEVARFVSSQRDQMAKIEDMIQRLMKVQSGATVPPSDNHSAKTITAPVEVTSMGLTESQVKKLNNIAWSVRQQGKLLKHIQDLLKAQNATSKTGTSHSKNGSDKTLKGIESSLLELKKQMMTLKAQQLDLQKEVEALKSETQKLASKPDPYSYKAKELRMMQLPDPKP